MNFINSKNLLTNSANTIVLAEKAQWSLFTPKGKFNIYQISNDIKKINFDLVTKNTIIIYINDRNLYGTYNDVSKPNEDLIKHLNETYTINKNISIYWKNF